MDTGDVSSSMREKDTDVKRECRTVEAWPVSTAEQKHHAWNLNGDRWDRWMTFATETLSTWPFHICFEEYIRTFPTDRTKGLGTETCCAMDAITQRQACLRLSEALSDTQAGHAESQSTYESAVKALNSAATESVSGQHGLHHATGLLAKYFECATLRSEPYNPTLCTLLADASRGTPFWRPHFGLASKPPAKVNAEQAAGQVPSDCVLEVARRIITRPWDASRMQEVRSALRVIANCCADNNINRSVIIGREGIAAMMAMASQARECDILIPALYNVCVDYDEPAVDGEGNPLGSPQQMETGSDQDDSGPVVNLAEQRLGMSWDSSGNLSPVEVLLKTRPAAQNCIGILADLVEMTSRVALYGLHYLIPTLHDNDSTAALSGDAQQYCSSLLRSVLTEGSQIASEDFTCSLSICQTLLNILSQPACQTTLMMTDNAFWQLIHVPYVCEEDDVDAAEALAPYREAMLKLVYTLSALDSYAEHVTPDSTLIHNCIDSLTRNFQPENSTPSASASAQSKAGLWASMAVLIANCISSTDRAVRLLSSTPQVASVLANLIKHTSDKEILLPTIDTATRLSLSREGQNAFHKTDMVKLVRRFLATTSEADPAGMDIQRETVTLIRFIIKGRPEHLRDVLGLSSTGSYNNNNNQVSDADANGISGMMPALMSLFQSTNDVRTKTEIGRLCIEILRTYFSTSPSSSSSLPHSTTSDDNQHQENGNKDALLLNLFKPSDDTVSTLTAADVIGFIITQPQPPSQPQPQSSPSPSPSPTEAGSGSGSTQAEAEAWFGLGLLSTLPAARPAIMHALSRNDHRLLGKLQKTVQQAHERQSPYDAETNTAAEAEAEQMHAIDEPEIKPTVTMSSTSKRDASKDPRYENIKVFVMNMLQRRGIASSASGGDGEGEGEGEGEGNAVQAVLEAAVTQMGLDMDKIVAQ
ncbi:hypothetical protein LTR20_005617 [Exophiala xenobiotica]|nr:hypothetical protein LTS13_001752 [Exophiala xenobiotica]KAK5400113.1 hypothetical protein LTR79_002212 [Exophiala xenobiotica]KAK5414032.1 hypothetical protein LTR90_006670 [Exophiala xenobiotica]KAK5463536.1 hypothetical protein LTR20_005617 [Exophiala xenobiotica]KAK5496417.1 hypothetical protein LTR83_004861 [Exophiala xenobiotica]